MRVLDVTVSVPSGAVTGGTESSNFMQGSNFFEYDAASQSYAVTIGTSDTFGPSHRTAASNASLTVYEKVVGAQTDNLVLNNAGAGNPRLVLTYASFGALQEINDRGATLDLRASFFAFGIPTAVDDMPLTGSATYTTLIDGLYAARGGVYSIAGSSSFAANFGTGSVDYEMTPVGTNVLTGASKTFGSTSGTGSITVSDTANFLAGAGPNALGYSSGIAGTFYGPDAIEMGGIFELTGPDGAGTGAMVGRKN